jgi:hypothetical protein
VWRLLIIALTTGAIWTIAYGTLKPLSTHRPEGPTFIFCTARRFRVLLEHCRGEAVGHKRKFRFKYKLRSIDSTTTALSLSMFDWAQYKRSKGAVKLHLVLDHDGCLPQYAVLSDGQRGRHQRGQEDVVCGRNDAGI